MSVKLSRKNREVAPEACNRIYEQEIVRKIRKRYTVNQELAILRQRDSKPKEFAEYNAFVEECKAEAKKQFIGGAD